MAYSLLLNMGLIRSGIAFPSSSLPRQFEILSVDDPYNCTTNSTTGLSAIPTTSTTTGAVSLYRRPLPTTNIVFLTTLQWDGREPDLFSLGLHSTRNHLQSTTDPTPAQLQQMVTFEGCDTQNQSTKQGTTPASMLCANTPPGSGIFTAQISDDDAKHLDAAGARGGPKALSQDLAGFFIGINDPFGIRLEHHSGRMYFISTTRGATCQGTPRQRVSRGDRTRTRCLQFHQDQHYRSGGDKRCHRSAGLPGGLRYLPQYAECRRSLGKGAVEHRYCQWPDESAAGPGHLGIAGIHSRVHIRQQSAGPNGYAVSGYRHRSRHDQRQNVPISASSKDRSCADWRREHRISTTARRPRCSTSSTSTMDVSASGSRNNRSPIWSRLSVRSEIVRLIAVYRLRIGVTPG